MLISSLIPVAYLELPLKQVPTVRSHCLPWAPIPIKPPRSGHSRSFSFSKFSFSFSTFRCSSHPTETQQRTPINDTYIRDWLPEFYLFLWFNNPKSFIGSASERLNEIFGLPYPYSTTDYAKALRQRAIGFLFYFGGSIYWILGPLEIQ